MSHVVRRWQVLFAEERLLLVSHFGMDPLFLGCLAHSGLDRRDGATLREESGKVLARVVGLSLALFRLPSPQPSPVNGRGG